MLTYFELLEIPAGYDVDESLLQKQYLLMQSKYHPDMAKDISTKNKYLNISAELNNAYKVLKDDLLRAEYLLKLCGINLDNASTKNVDEIWQVFELIDSTNDLDKLEELQDICLDRYKTIKQELSNAFDDMNLALDLTVSMKYLASQLATIKNKIDKCQL